MKTTKTIFAILGFILAGISILDGVEGVIFVSFSLVVAGIIGLVAKHSKTGNLIASLFYLGGYLDGTKQKVPAFYQEVLDAWTYFSLICAIVFAVGAFCIKKNKRYQIIY